MIPQSAYYRWTTNGLSITFELFVRSIILTLTFYFCAIFKSRVLKNARGVRVVTWATWTSIWTPHTHTYTRVKLQLNRGLEGPTIPSSFACNPTTRSTVLMRNRNLPVPPEQQWWICHNPRKIRSKCKSARPTVRPEWQTAAIKISHGAP